MGFSVRSLGLALAAALVVAPSIAAAQGAGPAAPPPGGGSPPPGGAPGSAQAPGGGGGPDRSAGAGADDKKSTGSVGGYAYSDKPVRSAVGPRFVRRAGGPLATFPGFEQLPDGGSRLFVQISQNVPVEERKAQGTITYVLKGAHLRVHNDANALVTVHFNTPVFRARLTPQGNDLLFILELRSAASAAFKVQDNQDKTATLMIDFPKGDFLRGDGNDVLPSEAPANATRATRGGKGGKDGRGGGRAAPPPAPANGDTDPTP